MSSTTISPAQPSASSKNFYIFGQGIAFSMSPTIHNAAFAYTKLPHTYRILESPIDTTYDPIISSPIFGGASVTMPHKVTIGRYCNEVTEHAQRIGAVNTLIVKGYGDERVVVGDNTDWAGLATFIRKQNVKDGERVGLVVGAGGASRAALYALHQSGVENIYLVNRTREKAEKIAQDMKAFFTVNVTASLDDLLRTDILPSVIIGTIPADRTTSSFFAPALFARSNGLCIDMSYKPRMTPLLESALAADGWTTVAGVDVLLEQGFCQFELWTGIPAPQQVMRDALAEHDARITRI